MSSESFRERCPYCGRDDGVSEEHILDCDAGFDPESQHF